MYVLVSRSAGWTDFPDESTPPTYFAVSLLDLSYSNVNSRLSPVLVSRISSETRHFLLEYLKVRTIPSLDEIFVSRGLYS